MHLVGPPSTDPVQTNTNYSFSNYSQLYRYSLKTISCQLITSVFTCAFHHVVVLVVFVDKVKSQLQGTTNIYCCPFPYTFPWNVHTVFPIPKNSTHQSLIMTLKCGTMITCHLLEKVVTAYVITLTCMLEISGIYKMKKKKNLKMSKSTLIFINIWCKLKTTPLLNLLVLLAK